MANERKGIDYNIDLRHDYKTKEYILSKCKWAVQSQFPESYLSTYRFDISHFGRDLMLRLEADIASRIIETRTVTAKATVSVTAKAVASVTIPATIWDAIKEKYLLPYFPVTVNYKTIEDIQEITKSDTQTDSKTVNIRECHPEIKFYENEKVFVVMEDVFSETRNNKKT